jgi:amino-acid N-acetyltransferase
MTTPAEMALRRATLKDIPVLLGLINEYASQQIMLPRTEFELAEHIRDFVVVWSDGELIGCGALHFYSPTSAEVRSLAVAPALKRGGVGRQIVAALEQEARENDLESIFAFTYVPGFFRKLGFEEVDRGELPLKAWKDCLRCPKFHACDEIAMLKYLRPQARLSRIDANKRRPSSIELVPLPNIKNSIPVLAPE